jgi:CBS domain-containing protein
MLARSANGGHPIAYVRVTHSDGTVRTRAEVICPFRDESVTVDVCARCPRFNHVDVGAANERNTVHCATVTPRPRDRGVVPLVRASVAEIMTRDVVCAHGALSLDAAMRIFAETGLRALPVIEADRVLLGFVTEVDVTLAVQSGRAPRTCTVSDVMSGFPLTLCESASIPSAAALLATEGQDRLAVLGHGGRLVGVVAASDVLRWLAHIDGH